MRKILMAVGVLAYLTIATRVVTAGQKNYEAGTVTCIEPIRPSLPIAPPNEAPVNVPVTVGYEFCVRHQSDLAYIGFCQGSNCQVEWHVGDKIQYRLSGNSIYLRRPNGKELRLDFTSEAKVDSNGRPVTIIRRAGKKK